MNVLVVDDNNAITKVVSKVLKLKGHDCTIINEGKKGFELISKNEYDLILLDLSMPEFNGLDLIKKLKSISKNVSKIVVFTALTLSHSQLLELKALGIKTVLKKPFTLIDLGNILSEQKSSLEVSS